MALNDAHPQIEILQPLSGRSIHQDWLDEHGEDHIGVLSSGEGFGADGSGKFAYLDTQTRLGMILEVIEPPTGLAEPIRRL